MKLPLISAHSGCEQTPRDSMDSIESAIALGADTVEIDVRRAEDGTLYVSHDRQEGALCKTKETLDTVFARIQNTQLRLNCDIKEPLALCGTLETARRFHFGPDRLILTGMVSPEVLAVEPQITNRASVYLNIEQVLKFQYMARLFEGREETRFLKLMNDANSLVLGLLENPDRVAGLIRLVKALKVSVLNLPYAVLTEELVSAFRAEQIGCSVWTVNDAADQERCFKLNVYSVTTLAVRSAIERRAQYQLAG